jgi:polysaccharide biosynthesis/export protein
VKAAGLRPAELEDALRAQYAKTLHQPEIAVIVKNFVNQNVYIGGEVQPPGLIPLSGRLTALQAVLQAGGLKDAAYLKRVIVISKGPDNPPPCSSGEFTAGDFGENPGN